MFFIPGFIISLLTFPGVIVREAAHQLMCRLTNTPVLKVCYFQTGDPAGYVVHDAPSSGWRLLLIALAPFLVNSAVGILICLPAALAVKAKMEMGAWDVPLCWLGISVAMHALPSAEDATSIWQVLKAPDASWLLRIIGFPAVAVIHLGAFLSTVWFDVLYAALLCFGIPPLVMKMLIT